MDKDHQNLDIAGLVKKLRYVTAAVQVMPFVYSDIFIVCMVLYLFCSDEAACACDTLFYVSPVTVVSFLILSRLLRMCVWHRTACVLPLIPQLISFVDRNVIEFPFSAASITIVTSIVLFATLLVAAYKTFIR